MFAWLAKQRRAIADTRDRLGAAFDRHGSSNAARLAYFFAYVWAQVALNALLFLIELPFYLFKYPTASFEYLARRDSGQSFLDSYSDHLRKYRLAVASTLVLLLAFAGEVYVLTRSIITVTQPTPTQAVADTITLNPVWDRTAQVHYDVDGLCEQSNTTYSCLSASATTLKDGWAITGCPGTEDLWRAAMKFDLSSIPDNATITDVILTVNVTNTTTKTVGIFPVTSNTPDTISCTDGVNNLYNKLGEGLNYTTVTNWNTTGSKVIDLGTTADSDVESRLVGNAYAIGFRQTSLSANFDTETNSTDAASNKPQLQISYTIPPEAPTNFSHTGNAETTIDWTWTDNATSETQYNVHDAAHAPVTGCSSLSANTTSCTETSLSANTQYSRHANVTDADGDTDSGSASAYTSIQTPSGISVGTTTETSITVSASGTISNLTSGSSGLWFEETVTGTNSGWIQTNSWQKTGLSPGTQYSFRVKARNGDGDETAFTSLQNATTNSPPAPEPEPTPEPAPSPSPVSTPTITNLSSGDTVIAAQPIVSGQGPANAAIFIVTNRVINTVVLSNPNGAFSAVLAKPLSVGSHEIFVRARSANGEVSDESDAITIQRVLAGIPVTIRERSITNGDSPSITFEGVAPTNSTVRILLDGSILQTFSAAPSSTPAYGFLRTITPPASLSAGTHTLSFVAINANGHPSLETGVTTFTKTSGGDTSFIGGSTVGYTVQPGDSLWAIAETFLGDGTRWDEIRQLNLQQFPSLNTQPTIIYTGWKLTLPDG